MNCSCGEEISIARANLGYTVCLDCGEKYAQKRITEKKKSVAVAYNKGSYQYLTSKQMAKDAGR